MFHRVELAERYAEALVDPSVTSSMPSGLFLAAPRRTGKSTFLREDLAPALERRDALVIYADFWADRSADPATVIAGAVGRALVTHAGDGSGIVERLGRRLVVEPVSVAGVGISTASAEAPAAPLGEALDALSSHTGKMIALLVDEAQHANTSEAGANALFALKAARDALNGGDRAGLRVVATGSNRDRLAGLVNAKAQAFYRATLLDLPRLDAHYVRWFVGRQPFAGELDVEAVTALFARAGHQPELLAQAADRLRLEEVGSDGVAVAERLGAHLEAAIAADEAELIDTVASLEPLARTVLCALAEHSGGKFSPFARGTLERYAETFVRIEGGERPRPPNVPAVQRALGALQATGLVWRSGRGVYALEEPRLEDLLRREGWIP